MSLCMSCQSVIKALWCITVQQNFLKSKLINFYVYHMATVNYKKYNFASKTNINVKYFGQYNIAL